MQAKLSLFEHFCFSQKNNNLKIHCTSSKILQKIQISTTKLYQIHIQHKTKQTKRWVCLSTFIHLLHSSEDKVGVNIYRQPVKGRTISHFLIYQIHWAHMLRHILFLMSKAALMTSSQKTAMSHIHGIMNVYFVLQPEICANSTVLFDLHTRLFIWSSTFALCVFSLCLSCFM